MENLRQSSNEHVAPVSNQEGERVLSNEEILEDVQRMCEAILHPKARIFKSRSPRMQKKVMRDFYDQNDVLPEHDASITKLLSLEILKKGFTWGEKSIIKKWYILGKHYLERTWEFDPLYFNELLEWANACLNNTPEEDEEKISFIIDGLDFLFWRAQKIIDTKWKNVNESERKFYELAWDFHSHFLGDFTSASEYYEVGAMLGDDSCHKVYCELMENAEDPVKAIPQIQAYWGKYKNIHYIEALIVLNFRAGNEKWALQAYNTYASLVPSPDPIFSFKRVLSLTDFAALDDSITQYHLEPGEHILDKQMEEQLHTVTMAALTRNAKVLKHLNEDESLQKEKGFEAEYQQLTTEQLLLFHRLIYWYLDFSVLGYYLIYLEELSRTDGWYEFLVDFFESHSVDHVDKLVDFFAKKEASEMGYTYEKEENSFADTFTDHMQFLLQHIGTSRLSYEHTIGKIEWICKRLGITDPDVLEPIDSEFESYQYLQGTLESMPRELYQLICKYQEILYSKYGQMFLRKIEYIIQFWHGSIPHQNDVDVMIYTFMMGCLFKNEVAIDSSIDQLKEQAITENEAQVLGAFATEYWIDDLWISMLTECCHPDDPDVLENICRIGIFNPDRIMEIYTNFSHNLHELSYEWENSHLLSFLDEVEEEVRTHSRNDISIPRILKIQWLAHWMEAKNLENLSREKDPEMDERAIFHKKKAERNFEDALSLIERFLHEKEIQENKEALFFTEREKEWIIIEYAKLLQEIGKEQEAFSLLQEAYPYTENSRILVLLAKCAMNANIRHEARKYITKLDNNGRIEATELWIEYYFRWDAEERLKAIQTLGGSSQEILEELNEELYDTVRTYAKERFQLLQKKWNFLTEDESREFFHLLRYQAITFWRNMELALLYWKELRKKVQAWDFDLLNEHFLKYVHPEELSVIGNKIKDDDKASHKSLINVRQESHIFYNIFDEKDDTTELMHEIMETFRVFPNGIGLGFIIEWEKERNDIEQWNTGSNEEALITSWKKHDDYEESLDLARKKYGIARVPTYVNYLLQ